MRDFSWMRGGTRIVYKTEPFDIWRTGTVKEFLGSKRIATVIKDRTDRTNQELTYVKYENIVGEATEKITPFPFYWGNVLEHLTEKAKENL